MKQAVAVAGGIGEPGAAKLRLGHDLDTQHRLVEQGFQGRRDRGRARCSDQFGVSIDVHGQASVTWRWLGACRALVGRQAPNYSPEVWAGYVGVETPRPGRASSRES